MKDDLLHRIDPDYYRETQLRIARAQIEKLLRERELLADVQRRSKIPLGTLRSPDAITRLPSRTPFHR
jgi:hypothetical protein